MLAYVFWHWCSAQIDAQTYEEYLVRFHNALATDKPAGYLSSKMFLLEQAPWLSRNTETYEDWYLIENSAALDPLNTYAISGQRLEPHNRVARMVENGIAGLYQRRFGEPHTSTTRFAYWFAKPASMSYTELNNLLQPLEKQAAGTLWQRYMTLGSTTEFCFHTSVETALPATLQTLAIPVQQVYSST